MERESVSGSGVGGTEPPIRLSIMVNVARETFMTNEKALQLVPGDRVAFGDEGVQTRIVTKVEKLPRGAVIELSSRSEGRSLIGAVSGLFMFPRTLSRFQLVRTAAQSLACSQV